MQAMIVAYRKTPLEYRKHIVIIATNTVYTVCKYFEAHKTVVTRWWWLSIIGYRHHHRVTIKKKAVHVK
jgi:hypothetical protein